MTKKNDWGKEIIQAGSDVAGLASDAGIPGIGLIAKFADHFYNKHLQNRFKKFVSDAEIDDKLLSEIAENESYSNYLYAILETVRQTHGKAALVSLALIYRDKWNNEAYLAAATRAFSQISDNTIRAFVKIYETALTEEGVLSLKEERDGNLFFHHLYSEAVELIQRNFFVMTAGSTGIHSNTAIHGMKWIHTESYYSYCKIALSRV
ncbi:hypothetical protein [Delftia sp. Cs1-4]|uniref:hypothetical protein n=1 Tax=Delftia sp. (strain Cs1-4) TaxID=742013 RepID=UPI000A05658F|nr:hypothetical protein [Delftia sp. Cs1-4]